jgi:hypothetical protein
MRNKAQETLGFSTCFFSLSSFYFFTNSLFLDTIILPTTMMMGEQLHTTRRMDVTTRITAQETSTSLGL